MKLRLTKGRIVCAVALLPVLYVLNVGPLGYAVNRLGLPVRIFVVIYWPLVEAIQGTWLEQPLESYALWWEEMEKVKPQDGNSGS